MGVGSRWLTPTGCVFQAPGELSFVWVWPVRGTGRRLKDGREKLEHFSSLCLGQHLWQQPHVLLDTR